MDDDAERIAAATEALLSRFEMISVRMFGKDSDEVVSTEPEVLFVHRIQDCRGVDSGCCIHGPSQHHMREWPLVWNSFERSMLRLCEHGNTHPDPDDVAFRTSVVLGGGGGQTVTMEGLDFATKVRDVLMYHECSCRSADNSRCCVKEDIA